VSAPPPDPDFESRVRASFSRQRFMATLGAELARVEPGEVAIRLPFDEKLTQQHGSLHAGAVAAVVDSACGYAALSLMEPGAGVVSVEFKINLLAPARGRLRAIGRVVRSGRTLTVAQTEVFGEEGKPVALLTATMMAIEGRSGLVD
jgi:uncharacterized protein (TIGR00369 family)